MLRNQHQLTILLIALLLSLSPASLHAQTAKKALDHDVYDFWQRIDEYAISNDGTWALYSMSPENGDATLEVKSLTSDQSYRVTRGESAKFSADSRHVVFLIKPPKDSLRLAKLDEKKPDDMPKDSLGILNLSNGELVRIERVKSYKIPEEAGGWLAYQLEKKIKDESEKGKKDSEGNEGEKKSKKDKKDGTTLVLRNLASGEEMRYDAATAYAFSEDGSWLAYAASSKDGSADGLFVVDTGEGAKITLFEEEGDYIQPAFDEASTSLAFLTNKDDYEADQPAHALYLWQPDSNPVMLADAATDGVPAGWGVSENGNLEFSKDGSRLFFGTAPRPEVEDEEKKTPEDEEVKIDIWNWQDPLLQPMQLVELEEEKKRTYLATIDLKDKRVVQLATQSIPEVELGTEGNADVVLGTSNLPYRQMISWDWPMASDIYVIDVKSGSPRLLQEAVKSNASLSPEGKYVSWWDRDEQDWFVQPVGGGEAKNLTQNLAHPVYDEIHDRPYPAGPYGTAGWTKNDETFLVYDKYDIWLLDPKGQKSPVNLTEGEGRKNKLRFRYARIDEEERAIDPGQTLLLSVLNMETKAGGFYTDRVNRSRTPEKLVMMDNMFSRPRKAKESDQIIFTRQSFEEFPNLWTSKLDMEEMLQVSDANPQQQEYLWGTAELISWVSLDGIPLNGILYKPEGFDPSQQYPMMVYFYEKMSDNLHRHAPPATARSSISYSFYTSRGYLVFVPDIPYRHGYPGESAVAAVVPGVTSLIEKGFVDAENIGVQGHSWGGYQIAYMITETNIFKAAEAGAPVVNMPSAYGGIRWASGMSRMFQYEQTQSRIGGSLWEYPMRYIDNSPLFQADKVETPLLMMHNDADGAVPWYQGIEFFVALRRLGKPVWMLNYNGEAHGLGKYHNKRDWAIRMQQFFDHYLKGASMPVWMEKGVPATMKGKTLGLELVEEETVTEVSLH